MVTHLRNFLEEHGLYVTVVKYLFTIFLSVMSYRNHSDWGYILVTAVEVISIAAITNIFAKEQKLIAYLVNSVLVLTMGTSKNTSRASRASNLSLIYSLFLVNFCL